MVGENICQRIDQLLGGWCRHWFSDECSVKAFVNLDSNISANCYIS